jgi:cytoskeleton-associated protein 5
LFETDGFKAHYGDDVYDFLSAAFDDPSATIVYPYVYRILNSTSRAAEDALIDQRMAASRRAESTSHSSPTLSRPLSPQETASSTASGDRRHSSPSRATSASSLSVNGEGFAPTAEEPDPDAQLLTIINHISSETTGAMHKEGITELHQFLKAYPHKKPRVEKMLESTGPAFRKYITRALASRAAEDNDRNAAVAHTLSSKQIGIEVALVHHLYRLSELESNNRDMVASPIPLSPVQSDYSHSPLSPRRGSTASSVADDKLSRLHNIFHYRTSTASNGSSHSRSATPSGLQGTLG